MQEKILKLGSQNISYKIFGKIDNTQPVIVILHGWGGKSESWIPVSEGLEQNGFTVIVPDLPGFGKTPLHKPYTLDDYANTIIEFVQKQKIDNIILWGHSNGGAISIKIALKNTINITTLVLNNSAGIRNNTQRQLKRKIYFVCAQIIKKYPRGKIFSKLRQIFYKMIGSQDYLNAEKNIHLKQTYLNMIASDLQKDIKKVQNNTLIIWGEKDRYTPLRDGMYMTKNIKKSKMIILEKQTHGIHLHEPSKLVDTFINNI